MLIFPDDNRFFERQPGRAGQDDWGEGGLVGGEGGLVPPLPHHRQENLLGVAGVEGALGDEQAHAPLQQGELTTGGAEIRGIIYTKIF